MGLTCAKRENQDLDGSAVAVVYQAAETPRDVVGVVAEAKMEGGEIETALAYLPL